MPGTLEGISLKDRLVADYEIRKTALLLENPLMVGFRNAAFEAFRRMGFPTRKNEEYKYLSFDKTLLPELSQPMVAPEQEIEASIFAGYTHDFRAVLLNGFFSEKYSVCRDLPPGVIVGSLSEAIRSKNVNALATLGTLSDVQSDPFLALNSALFADGLFVYIPDHTELDRPLHIIQVVAGNEPLFVQPRILVMAGRGAKATFVHSFVSSQATAAFSNTVSEIAVEENAQLEWVTLQQEQGAAGQVNTTEAHLKRDARFKAVTFSLEGRLVRNNLNIVLDAPGCEAHLYGYYHPRQGQVFDNHTLVDHRMPHCESNELYKGVIDGDGAAIFNGKVMVRPDAQKTNAYQSNKNILLSSNATVNTKPQLEIYADDVKCSHGSSTGFLDPEQLFYLRSRGISLDRAKSLLLHAYAGDVLEHISAEPVRLSLEALLATRF